MSVIAHYYKVFKDSTFLPLREIAGILVQKHPSNFIVGGRIDHKDKFLYLYRGNGEVVDVPFEYFMPNAVNSPDFTKLKIVDYGLGIQLGASYEASVHTMLKELGLYTEE